MLNGRCKLPKRYWSIHICTLVMITCFVYPAKSTTYYVSFDKGSDANKGTLASPFETISKAAWSALPGDTIFVREGIYRERISPPRGGEEGAPIVYLAEPNKRVIIKGSEVWFPQWESQGDGIFVAKPDDALFNDIRSDYIDHYNPFKVNLSSTPYQREGRREWERGYEGADSTLVYTCGQVFVNGKQYKEVPFKKELESETWYYEPSSERIFIHFGDLEPKNQNVEITTRRRIFAPVTRGLGYIVVQGFIMEHCGNNYPTNFWAVPKWGQRGAMGLGMGHHWVVRKNVIRYAKSFAMDAGHVDQLGKAQAAHDNLIELNYILENGSAGILSNSSKNMVIRDNVVMYNNTMRFLGRKRWEQAGIKCHNILNGEVYDNYVAHNYLTYGVWFDNKFPDSRISRNILLGNGRAGLFLEMSDYDYDRLFVDNNILIENKQNPIYVHDASGATFMHNLIANSPEQDRYGQGVIVHQVGDRTKTYHHSFYNNLFINNPITMDIDYPAQRGGKQRSDFNVYDAKAKDRVFRINSATQDQPPWTNEEFLALIKKETGSEDLELAKIGFSGRVPLTLEEWKSFWKTHDEVLDANSLLKKGSTVTYDPNSHELVLDIPYHPNEVGSKNHEFVDVDFFNSEISQNEKALPGPFQSLKKGKNKFMIWDGLPILSKGELPDPVAFSSFER